MGDWNSHHPLWGSAKNNNDGDKLAEIIDKLDLTVLNNEDITRFNSEGIGAILDIVVASFDIDLSSSFKVFEDADCSDYFPTCLDIQLPSTSPTENRNRSIYKYKTNRADWTKYQEECREIVNTKDTENFNEFQEMIIKAAEISIPINSKKNEQIITIWWDNECQEAVNKRRNQMKQLRIFLHRNILRNKKGCSPNQENPTHQEESII